MTTSPIEIQNNVIKHGHEGVNARTNLNKTIEKATKGTNRRLEKQNTKAMRAMGMTNLASRAPTKEKVGLKGQRLADANYDARHILKGKSVMVNCSPRNGI